MLGIIGAMDVEVNLLKTKITEKTITNIAGIDFVLGNIENVMVCAAQCSPGKVNAALCAQIMIDKFCVDSIINIGVGCSLNENVLIKNIVVASDVCQYDIDVTALGEPRGYINGLNAIKIQTDKALSEKLARAAIACGERIHRGTVASGDTFIANRALKKELAEEFNAVCGEMEGGAVGQVCRANNVPFAVLRSICDDGNENSAIDYPTFKKIAADISASILLSYVKTLKTQLEFNA